MRRRWIVALLVLVAVALGKSNLAPDDGPVGGIVALRFAPVPLDPHDPARRVVGALTFLRGWTLTSPSPEFGGLSALRRSGADWLAVSDRGALVRFRTGEQQASIEPVPPRCGPARVRLGRDLEGLATDGRRLWVSSEWHNTVCRRDADGRWSGVRPAAMAGWTRNWGPETLLRLDDGRFLVLSNSATPDALLFARDPVDGGTPRQLRYIPPSGYAPTDAAQLPDGRIVVLNRRFDWLRFSAVLVLFDTVPARGIAQGRELARLEAPLVHDNFEGVAARRKSGRTVLTLISDNNFNVLQRTLLLEFALD